MLLLVLAVSTGCGAAIVIEDAFCRGGQVFLHWADPDTQYIRYHIYRSSDVIDNNSISQAQLIDGNVPLNSAKDAAATSAAFRRGEPDPDRGYRIFDLAEPLDKRDGLKVITVDAPADRYYAVVGVNSDGTEDLNIVVGQNSLSSAIHETSGNAVPVLDEKGVQNVSGYDYPWETYTWFKRNDESLFDGEATKITITLPKPNLSGKYATMLYLHAINGTNRIQPWWNLIIISPMDCSPNLPHGGNSWWYGYCSTYPSLSGTVINYTENMLLHMLGWAKSSFPIDEDRVTVSGGSMGGTGALSFGLRHPELFSSICATVPQVNPGLPDIGWSQTQLRNIWGSLAANLPSDEGVGVWDRQNSTAYVTNHPEDIPFIKVQNSKNDDTLKWFQVPQFYYNLNENRHAFIAAWGQGGHVNSSSGLPPEYTGFDVYTKIKRSQSYPAVSNSSSNNNPGNGDPSQGDSVGQMNAGYDWQIRTDTPTTWVADIKYTVSGGTPTADISPRRLQQFDFASGDRLAYIFTEIATGQVIAGGYVTAQRGRFVTVPNIPFANEYRRLTIRKTSGQTIPDLIAFDEDGDVDLDEIIITAVFADVAYACNEKRVLAVALLGAHGFEVGDSISLHGTKTMFGGMVAVNVSQFTTVSPSSNAIRPIGSPGLDCSHGRPLQLGVLVKVWGRVLEDDNFVIDSGSGPIVIYGGYGVKPAAGTYVAATGICSEMQSAGVQYGVRVRDAQDIISF